MQVELTQHRDECHSGSEAGHDCVEFVQDHDATVGRAPQAAHTPFVVVCLHRLQFVAAAANRHETFRPGRVALDLPPDVRDVEIARTLVADVGAVPEVTHDLPPRETAPRLAGYHR